MIVWSLFIIDASIFFIFFHFSFNFHLIQICVTSPSFSPIFLYFLNYMPIISCSHFQMTSIISLAINKPKVMPTIVLFPTFNLEYVSYELGLIFPLLTFITWNFNSGLLQNIKYMKLLKKIMSSHVKDTLQVKKEYR